MKVSESDRRTRCCAVACALALLLCGCGAAEKPEVEIFTASPTEISDAETRAGATPTSEPRSTPEEPSFVLNPSTLRFHLPGCVWAQRIAPERRIEYDGDREQLLAVGYEPCRYCKP